MSDDFDLQMVQDYEVKRSCSTRDTTVCAAARVECLTGQLHKKSISVVPKLFLAGGLSPENIEEAIEMVRPLCR